MMNTIKNQKGFTLIESILTTMILAVTLFGGLFLMQNAARHSITSDYDVIASQLANEKLEMILADKAMKGGKYMDITTSNYPAEDLPFNGVVGVFEREVTVNEVSPSDLSTPQDGSGMKKVDVTVKWGEKSTERIEVSTLLANY